MTYIEFKGKKYPFVFGWSAFKQWQKSISPDEDELDFFEDGCYLGFVYGAKHPDVKEKVDLFKKEELVEEMNWNEKFQEQIFEEFSKQMGKQKKILLKMGQNLQ